MIIKKPVLSYISGGSSVKLHLEADVFAAAVIQTDHCVVELGLLRRVKPGHSAPALVQQLLCNLLGQLLFLAGKELVVFPQAEGAFLVRAVEVALADIDRRAATGAFADFLFPRAETLGFGIGEKRVGFHEIPGHPDNAAEKCACIRIAALNLHERVFPFRSHCGRGDLFRQNTDKVMIYALYKKTTFEGTSYVLNLDANGGMIEDEFVKKYDYLGAVSYTHLIARNRKHV